MVLGIFAVIGVTGFGVTSLLLRRQRRKIEKRKVTLFDWNILAPIWIDINEYKDIDGDLNLLHEGKRLLLVIHRILESDADIVTLQEVQEDQYDVLCSELGHKYESLGLVDHVITYWTDEWLKEDTKKKKNGQATFLRNGKFKVAHKKKLQTTEDGNSAELVVIEPAKELFEEIFSLAPLWTLILANCHLESGMVDWKHVARSKQVNKIHDEVESLSDKLVKAGQAKSTVIIAGDFNTYQDQLGMMEVRKHGYIDIAEMMGDIQPTFIVPIPYLKDERQLDHIVVRRADLSERVEVKKFHVPDVSSPAYDASRHKEVILKAMSDRLTRRVMSWAQGMENPDLFDIITHIPPSKKDYKESNALRALRIGSDHLPLYAEFYLK